MDEPQPGEIGAAFLNSIRSRWPKLLPFATVASSSQDLVIDYPSPFRSDGECLHITADADLDELIIGFGGGHSHGASWRHPGDPDHEFRGTIRFIEGIFEERVVGATLKAGGWIGELSALKASEHWASVRAVRSWRGTHDQGLENE